MNESHNELRNPVREVDFLQTGKKQKAPRPSVKRPAKSSKKPAADGAKKPRPSKTVSAAPPPELKNLSQLFPGVDSAMKRVVIISDGTGETAAAMISAAMVQFSDQNIEHSRYKNVRKEEQLNAIFDEIVPSRDLVVHTLVRPQMRALLLQKAAETGIACVDLLGPLLAGLGNHFGFAPRAIAGLLHDVNERYFHRIAAMEYTIQHDDGKDLNNLDQADIVILGISRTSKTPLSMYLCHHGWKVANIPLIKGFEVPREVLIIDQRRIIGLTIDPITLAAIRRNRLERLGQDRGGEYADEDKVNDEIEWATEIFRTHRRWPLYNVTGKALEETASEIIRLMASRRLLPQMAASISERKTEDNGDLTSGSV